MNEQELNQRFQAYEGQIRQLQEQSRAIEQAVIDMSSINLGLDELKGKVDEEILAPMGRGIFIKAKLLSEDLIVDVGELNFVDKSIGGTKELIKEQSEKLKGTQKKFDEELEKINQEITTLMSDYQKEHAAKQ